MVTWPIGARWCLWEQATANGYPKPSPKSKQKIVLGMQPKSEKRVSSERQQVKEAAARDRNGSGGKLRPNLLTQQARQSQQQALQRSAMIRKSDYPRVPDDKLCRARFGIGPARRDRRCGY